MTKEDLQQAHVVESTVGSSRTIEITLPRNGPRPKRRVFQGKDAMERLRRFFATYLATLGDLSEQQAQEIIQTSTARRKKN